MGLPGRRNEDDAPEAEAPRVMPDDNAPDVPAFQEDTGAQDGVLHNQLVEEGVTGAEYTDEQASEEAERAASPEQAKKAAKASRTPRLNVGQRIIVSADAEQHANRSGSVESIEWADQAAETLASLGTPESRFAEVKNYGIRFRDGVGGYASIPANLVEKMEQENFGRGRT